jgi:hypothetical protein
MSYASYSMEQRPQRMEKAPAAKTHFESPQRGVKLSDARPGSSAGATKGQLQFQSVPDADITLLFAPCNSVRFR